MKSFMRCLFLLVTFGLPASASASESISSDERTFFEEKIRPVLVNHCAECHAHQAGAPSAEYAVDSPEGLRAGGVSGEAAVVPGDPAASLLLQALRYGDDLQMPPSEPLPKRVVDDFERWIVMGAPDPRSADAEQLKQLAQQKSAAELWSLQPPVAPEVPSVEETAWPRTEIDRFVLARLEQADLTPVADADPAKLIRRLYFDLIGLPPEPAVVRDFAANPSPEAYKVVIDRLLQSPRFGERWGRHWLDLARYAESSGMEFNFTYPHAWPYRDYVIDAFNQDKPYDRFITEQLAGDLLPSEDWQQRDAQRLATGFLAVGPKRHNAGTKTFRMEMVDDQIKATTEAFLGLTVGCARCHDHKFDPIPTKDYYSLAGIFLSTKTLFGTTKIKYSRHPTEKIAFGPQAAERHAAYQAHQAKRKKTEEELKKQEAALKKLQKEQKKEQADKEQAKKEPGDKEQTEKQQRKLEQTVAELKTKVKQLKTAAPQPPQYGMGAGEGEPTDTHVAVGGDPNNRGDTVPRGFLSAVAIPDPPGIDEQASGRLQLARWITHPENPLTARVMVNRVWHHLFGRGLVASVNNFGMLGERPSHPALLDHLAVRFQQEGWSIKQLIRQLVRSRVYQLSSRKEDARFAQDPDNVLLWRMRPRRLEVEPLRDAILAVSGRLDRRRPAGSSVTPLGQQLARGVSAEKLNPKNHHRTVYLPVVRHYAAEMLQEFDFAASSLVVGDRAETTTSQQALFFLNNEFILEQATAAAERLQRDAPGDPAGQIRWAYLRTVSRAPSAAEQQRAETFLRRTGEALTATDLDEAGREQTALASFVQALFGSAEFRYLLHAPGPAAATSPDEAGSLAAAPPSR